MGLEKNTAIVLRVVEFSETSCIVTMMTRDHGKITAMAKGARRPKSPFEAALDVLSVCRIVFLKKRAGAMDLLTEARLERRFRSGVSSLPRLYAGYYVAELLNLLTDDADPHPDLFEAALYAIEAIDGEELRTGDGEPVCETVLDFELNSLFCLGHLPMLTQCVSCGREKTTLNRVSFGMNAGGILCRSCRPGNRNVVSLSSNGFQFLLERTQQLLKRNASQSLAVGRTDLVREAKIARYSIGSDTPASDVAVEVSKIEPMEEVKSLLRTYITHLIGYPPKSQKFLNPSK